MFVGAFLASVFLFSGCIGGASFVDVHSSGDGYLLEEVLPADTWFTFSISTLDDEQQNFLQDFVAKFSDDPNAFRDEVLSGIDENLASIDMSYMKDIAPIIGADGVRFMLALSEGDSDAPVTHAVITLRYPEKAQDLFDALEEEGRFVRKVVNGYDLYFNVYAADQGQEVFYFAIYDDLFLIANNDDELAEMLDLAKSKGDHNLWSKDVYQAVIRELPTRHVGMFFMDGSYLAAKQEGDISGMALSNDMIPYLAGQGMAFVATDEGLEIKGIALGDRAKIDADETSLDELKAKSRYLAGDMVGANLGVYLESYNLGKSIKKQAGVDNALIASYLSLFGLDTSIDFESFLGEGYGLVLHDNGGFLPGLTVMADVSGDRETAQTLIDNIDAQISGLLGVFQMQGGTIAEAVSKQEVEVKGMVFDQIHLNLDSLMGVYDTSGAFNLPEELKGQSANLIYGITNDDRLIISTYDGWLEDSYLMLDDTENYKEISKYLGKYKEGVMYIDFEPLSKFISTFTTFRDALKKDAEALNGDVIEEVAPIDEAVATIEEGEISEPQTEAVTEVFDWQAFLEPLKSFGFASKADKYEVRLGGVILLDEE